MFGRGANSPESREKDHITAFSADNEIVLQLR